MTPARNAIYGALLALAAASAHATPVQAPCTLDSWTITSAGVTGTPMVSTGTINDTSCIGVYGTPNNIESYFAAPPNLGYLNDGLLNGQGGIVSPTQFISPSQLLALNPATPGQKIDPGWIQLGTLAGNSGSMTASNVTPVGGSPFNLSQVVSYSQTTVPGGSGLLGSIGGNWTLTVNADIVNILHSNGLFSRNNFDQLAIEVKAGSNWAVYDFDFTKLSGFDLTKPYTLSGTWNLDDFRNPQNNADQAISGLTIWARDPLTTTSVPEPGSLPLVAAGLIGLAMLAQRRARTNR